LFARDGALIQSLDGAKARLAKFAASTAGMGIGLFSAGSKAAKGLDELGNLATDRAAAMASLSAATGTSTERLSALEYAAGTVGVPFEQLAGTLKGFSSRISQAADAGDETFARLGIGYQELLGLPLDESLERVATALANVANPGDRTRMAEELGLAELLPLLNQGASGLRQLKADASNFGSIVTSEDAAKAREFSQQWNQLQQAVRGFLLDIGRALIPSREFTSMLANGMRKAGPAVKSLAGYLGELANKAEPVAYAVLAVGAGLVGLAGSAAAVGVALKGASVVLPILGSGLKVFGGAARLPFVALRAAVGLLPAAFGLMATAATGAFGLVTAAAGLMLSPFGLIAVGAVAAGAAYVAFSQNGADNLLSLGETATGVFGSITESAWAIADSAAESFASVRETGTAAWSGISAAIQAGDLQAAAEVALAALHLEWVKITGKLKLAWEQFTTFVTATWKQVQNVAANTWEDLTTWVAKRINDLMRLLRVISAEERDQRNAALDRDNTQARTERDKKADDATVGLFEKSREEQAKLVAATAATVAEAQKRFAEAMKTAATAATKAEAKKRESEKSTAKPASGGGSGGGSAFAAAAIRGALLQAASGATFAQAFGVGDKSGMRDLANSARKTADNTAETNTAVRQVESAVKKLGEQGLAWG
jgi:hypothetical protein